MNIAKIVFFFSALMASAFAATFQDGTAYTAVTYEGNVWVQCSNGSHRAICSAYDLQPSMVTRLVSGADADRFEITSTDENGKVTKKDGKFNAANGESGSINLWITTLFQRPLLKIGANKISYNLTQNGTSVESGEFEATVERGGRLYCDSHTLFYSGSSCPNISTVCSDYFARARCR